MPAPEGGEAHNGDVCGRYAALRDAVEIAEYFAAEQLPLSSHEEGRAPTRSPVVPDYNVTPTRRVFIVMEDQGTRRVDSARWGLIPSWSKDASRSARMINARSETVSDKPAYRSAFRRRRCLVPADGYYEWQGREGAVKQPFFFHDASSRPLALAGLYEDWPGPEGLVRSCTIVTQDARGVLARIHDRMPVLVDPTHWSAWLDPATDDPDSLLARVLADGAVEELLTYPVSTLVNKPGNNGPELLAPVDTDGARPAT